MAAGVVADLTVLQIEERVLDSGFVRRLVRGVERDENGNAVTPQPSGARVRGLRVEGDLDLGNLDVPYPVELTEGHFKGRVDLLDTGLRSLRLDGSTFEGPVDAGNLETRSDFSAANARFQDWLSLAGAEIHGDLWLWGAHLGSKKEEERLAPFGTGTSREVPLDADGIEVGGSVFLQAMDQGPRFEAAGEVRLLGAKIGGQLSCLGGSFQNPDGNALSADGIEVGGGVFLQARDQGPRFEAAGAVRLLGAKIGGQLSCLGGSFQNPDGNALSADGIEVGGGVFLQARDQGPRFEAAGAVRLLGAKIGGQLSCLGGSFHNPTGDALSADGIEVGGSVHLRALDQGPRFEAAGAVRLLGAKIGGQFSCIGGSFHNKSGSALAADGMEVKDGVLVRPNSGIAPSFAGNVSLVAVKIDGHFQWREVEGEHGVDLCHASAVTLDLDQVVHPEMWQLNGFRYHGLAEPENADGAEMLKLLRECDGQKYFPQPYRQLFRVLRDAGHAEEATNVAVAMREQAFVHERVELSRDKPRLWWARSWLSEFWQWVSWLIGYGYRPWRAVGIALTLWLIGTVAYSVVALGPFESLMAPAEGDLLAAAQAQPEHDWRSGGPPFVSWLYSLDRFMPVVDLGQASFFRPKGSTGFTILGADVGWWLSALDWVLIASGWILSLLFAGSVSGLMRKIDSDT
ncbi:MAG TPA: hypothetical protein PLO61_10235 [Fimbriimonadaceae bacterium]|nr:hypothetical protein [Fimbriimonadaceae bacterium]HRJ33981.1 hypothetical protein [Fimbriimonadaceae bacterium]